LDDGVISQAKSVKDEKIQIISVNKNSPAQEADLRIGDVILGMDGKKMQSVEILQDYADMHTSEIINLKISRLDTEMEMQIMPQVLETSNGKGVFGIGVVETGLVVYPWYLSLWKGAVATYNLLIAIFIALFGLIKSIIGSGEVSVDVAGPIGIAVMTGQFARMGIVYLIQFAALLTLNLAIINILPFPALDGGRLLFLLIEKIRGREVNQKIEALVHNIGFIILMILIVFVTYRDVARWGGQIIDKFF